jgi:dephospho-CoA kinase
MMKLAITGYIGVGKSTAAKVFSEKGYIVISADEVGHKVLDRLDVLEKLRALFGLSVLGRNLKIDREKLAKAAFISDASLKKLSAITHPPLREELRKAVESSTGNIAIDAALYGKLGIPALADKTLLIKADPEKVYSRLGSKYSKREILNVMNNQEIISAPDYVVENNSTVEEFRKKVADLINKLT